MKEYKTALNTQLDGLAIRMYAHDVERVRRAIADASTRGQLDAVSLGLGFHQFRVGLGKEEGRIKEMSHTPGPWSWSSGGTLSSRAKISATCNNVVVWSQRFGFDNEADKVLIAAAPELLAMCQQFVEVKAEVIRVLSLARPEHYDGGYEGLTGCDAIGGGECDCGAAAINEQIDELMKKLDSAIKKE